MDTSIFDVAVTFNLGTTPKQLQITDNTPYAANFIPLVDVAGVLTVTGPSGIFYNNTNFGSPDIDHDVSLTKLIDLPLTSDGNVEQGNYVVELQIQVTDEAFYPPIVAVSQADGKFYVATDLRADVLASSPGTVSASSGNDGTYTVDAVTFDATTQRTEIDTSTDPLPSAIPDGLWGYTITKQYTDTTTTALNFTVPSGKLKLTYDCDCAKLTSEDITAYGDVLSMSRLHTVTSPLDINGNPVTTSNFISETIARGNIVITNAGGDNDFVVVTINNGADTFVIGSYDVQAGDTDIIVANSLAVSINAQTSFHGYSADDSTNNFDVIVPAGLGAAANSYVLGFSTSTGGTATATVNAIGGGITQSGLSGSLSSSQAVIITSELWTNTWKATLSNTVVYQQTDGTFVSVVITAMDEIEVKCDDNICCIYTCINTINTRFQNALCENPQEAKRLKDIFLKMYGHWILYSIAKNCGKTNDKKTQFEAIKSLVNAEDCNCCNSDADNYPVQVIPLCGLPAASTGNTYVVDAGLAIQVTANTVGNTTTYTVAVVQSTVEGWINSIVGAITLDDISGVTITTPVANEVLQYNGTIWVNGPLDYANLGDVTITSIADGQIPVWVTANGRWENERASSVLFSDGSDQATPGSTSETDLYSTTISANTLKRNGDRLKIYSLINKAGNTNIVFIRLKLGGTTYFTFGMSWANSKFTIDAHIERIGASLQRLTGVIRYNLATSGVANEFSLDRVSTEDETINNDLKITGENAVASAADATGKHAVIEYNPKYT